MANYQLGPCDLWMNGVSLGRTVGGVTVKVTESSVDLHTDQDGDVPVDTYITGNGITIEASLAEMTLANIASIVKSTVASNQVKLIGNLGMSLLTNAREFLIKPYENGTVTGDKTKMLLVTKGGIKSNLDIPYDSKSQRSLKFTIVGYPDTTVAGSPLAVWGATAKADIL